MKELIVFSCDCLLISRFVLSLALLVSSFDVAFPVMKQLVSDSNEDNLISMETIWLPGDEICQLSVLLFTYPSVLLFFE